MSSPLFDKKPPAPEPPGDDTADYEFWKADPGTEAGEEERKFLEEVHVLGAEKQAGHRWADDEWRDVLSTHGFGPAGSGAGEQEVWRSAEAPGAQVLISHDEDGDPFWGMFKDGREVALDDTASLLETMLAEVLGRAAPEKPEPCQYCGKDCGGTCAPELPPNYDISDEDKIRLHGFGAVGKHKTVSGKRAGREPRFSFAVPMQAAGKVAFLIAKAGLQDFEVVNYEGDGESVFSFMTEPELHVAEDLVKAEYAAEIGERKGLWAEWAPKAPAPPGPAGEVVRRASLDARGAQLLLRAADGLRTARLDDPLPDEIEEYLRPTGTRTAGAKAASQWGERSYDCDSVHDILDHYREGSTFDTPVPAENVPRLLEELEIQGVDDPDTGDDYLGVVVFLATHGADVPPVYRQRARAIALAMAEDEEYLRCWTNPRARQAELEKEADILGSKTAALHPDDYVSLLKSLPDSDSGPGMTDDEVRKMERYRRKKLVAWLDEIGIDDEMLKAWDAGDFWKRDEIYEEVRDMVKEDRRFQTHYRRTMRGPRPYNRKPKASAEGDADAPWDLLSSDGLGPCPGCGGERCGACGDCHDRECPEYVSAGCDE